MKFAMIGLVASLTSFAALASTPANVEAPAYYRSEITRFNVDEKFYNGKIESGEIRVDYVDNTVTLTLRPEGTCDATGRICLHYMPAPIQITLPIVSISNSCGSKVIEAAKDERYRDADLRSIKVMDHTTRLCEDIRPYIVEATYETVGSGFNPTGTIERTRSYFGGKRLEAVYHNGY